MKVNLTPAQEKLKKIIQDNLLIAKNWQNQERGEVELAFNKMKIAAHELHMQLTPKPKHHEYMIKNRRMQPEDPEFYNHIHPVEDLLEYLEDTSANDDPIDQTIGDEFEFRIYSNRWGHHDLYRLTRTENGWYINHLSYRGEDGLYDNKVLYASLRHDSISFPTNVDSYLASIWEIAKIEGLTHNEVQEMLNRVADWISQTEMNAPRDLLI
ncbi:hypothetical protein [Brevibacillus dissolubilis]|uniref:hypothetical protein n=1 Tax=Brevibacillus dissolubilis TaxID=1844116 RepID=UPI001117A7E3|nr:hypothetical protein [Brevibacillus dissolubilis]